MLRCALILLLLFNALYGAWTQGLLRAWGLAPQERAEPQRIAQQIRPETLQILAPGPGLRAAPAGDASVPSAAPPIPIALPAPIAPPGHASAPIAPPGYTDECLQAGVFDEAQAAVLRLAAAALPPDSWALEPAPLPGRWMVYMGRFEDAETLEKKRAELRARKIDFDRAGGAWEPGLSLGRFSSETAAKRELLNLGNKGVRTARVIQERAEAPGFTLRLPAANDALRAQLDPLRNALAGKTLRRCANATDPGGP